MPIEDMIPASEFCTHHNIELSFIYLLNQSGLVEIIMDAEKIFLPASQLSHVEKLVRLHYEMGINLEGIETITYLLQRIKEMQQQIETLHNRLSIYENGGA
jgi:chaperone modulatory protein CbpM